MMDDRITKASDQLLKDMLSYDLTVSASDILKEMEYRERQTEAPNES